MKIIARILAAGLPVHLLLLSVASIRAETGVQAWVRRYSGLNDAYDVATKAVSDAAGNVIVSGYTSGITGRNMLIIKYSAVGVALWTNRYDGAAGGDSHDATPAGLAVDGNGDVVVTGSARGYGDDYFTIKYSSAGVPLWTNRYDGPGGSWDYPTAVAVATSGEVFVTGYVTDANGNNEYATVAYSASGAPLWTNLYALSPSANAYGEAVAVDGGGNAFVTGGSRASGGPKAYTTIKYSIAGMALWTNHYQGPGNGLDQATAIVVDAKGDAFVTGYSLGSTGDYDYATIKYSSAGIPLWTNRYGGLPGGCDEAYALALDGDGNVAVTGSSYGGAGTDFATIKYSNGGVPLWTNRYHGPLDEHDYAVTVVADESGNVLVTGSSEGGDGSSDYATVKYSSTGVPLWTNRFNGPANGDDRAQALAVDAGGNAFVTGYSDGGESLSDFATIKYSSAGAPLWTNRYSGPAYARDVATAVAVDTNGNVFVTGWSGTIKYSSTGTALWTNHPSFRQGTEREGANAMVLDGNGDVVVAGFAFNDAGAQECATAKFSSAGMLLWTNRYNGGAASAVALDGSGNVFVASSPGIAFATVKYSSGGIPLWTNRYYGPGNSVDYASALAVDGNGNVFVTGSSIGSGSGWDFATIKYSNAGVALWTNRFNGPANGFDEPADVAVDSANNVIVTGYSTGLGGNDDYATIKYSNAGAALWTNYYNGPGNDIDHASAVAVDKANNVIVTGYSWRIAGDLQYSDYATIKYSSAGVPLWTNRYNGPGNGFDGATAVAVDGNGNVFVTGNSWGGSSSNDYATVKYSSAGVPLWTNRYNGPGNGTDNLQTKSCLALAPDGSAYVTGYSVGYLVSDYATVKYVSIPELVTSLTADGSGGYFIRLNGVPGSAYRLQRASSVFGPWTTSASQTAPASGFLEFHDLFPPPGQAFYRALSP